MRLFVCLVAVCCLVVVQADVKHATNAWNVDKKYAELWSRMEHAVSPEAARFAEAERTRRSDDNYGDSPVEMFDKATPETLDHVVGRFDDDQPTMIFEHMLDLIASEEWDLLEHAFTPDITFVDHTSGDMLRGAHEVVEFFHNEVDSKKQKCLRLRCSRFGVSVEHVASNGPVAVFRVTEAMQLTSDQTARTLFWWNIILRPPGPSRSLAHSQMAVLERMSSTLHSEYTPPVELFKQKEAAQQFVNEYIYHWHDVHRRAIAEQEEAIVRNMNFGAANPDRWADKARRYCNNRKERGEVAETFDCDQAQEQFAQQARVLKQATEQHRRRRAQKNK